MLFGMICAGLVLVCQNAIAQDKRKVDSLQKILNFAVGKEKSDTYLELGLQFSDNNILRANNYADSAYQVALQVGDSAGIVASGRVKGQLLRRLDRVDESIIILNKVLPTARRNKFMKDYKRILNALAVAYSLKADYDAALKCNFESLVIREAEGNKAEISISLNNIGFVYFKLDDSEHALKYYNKSLALKKEVNDKTDLDVLLINIGLCYNQLHHYKEAFESIQEAFEVCGGHCSKLIEMEGKFGLGVSSVDSRRYTAAEGYLLESYNLAKELNDTRFELESLTELARTNNLLHNDAKVRKFLSEAQTLAVGTGYNQSILNIYREFYHTYAHTKEFEKAAAYQAKYIALNDSIFSKDLIKNLATVQTNYEERENIKTIKDKDIALALKEETLKRKEAESLFIVVVSILVFVLAVLMFQLFRLTQRANVMLEVRVDKRTKELNDSNEALAKVNGELDNFIYKTSHDIRGPLASLKGICNVAIMDVQDEAALSYLQKLDLTAEKLNRILTRLLIINQINHAVLAANVISFEELFEDILFLERKKGIPRRLAISYQIEKGVVLKSDREMLRIVMENLIDNGIKFYNESERIEPFVKIHVSSDEKYVCIRVTDNGVGINDETKEKIFQMFVRASERSETGGIGLYLSRLATGRLEGKIDFRTTAEKHTEFSVRLPLDLGPVLEARREQERITEFERIRQTGKQNTVAAS